MGVCGAYYLSERPLQRRPENSLQSLFSTIAVLFLFTLTLTIHYHEGIGNFMQARLPYEAGLYAPVVLLLIINLCTEKNLSDQAVLHEGADDLRGDQLFPLHIAGAGLCHLHEVRCQTDGNGSSASVCLFFVSLIIIASVVTAA